MGSSCRISVNKRASFRPVYNQECNILSVNCINILTYALTRYGSGISHQMVEQPQKVRPVLGQSSTLIFFKAKVFARKFGQFWASLPLSLFSHTEMGRPPALNFLSQLKGKWMNWSTSCQKQLPGEEIMRAEQNHQNCVPFSFFLFTFILIPSSKQKLKNRFSLLLPGRGKEEKKEPKEKRKASAYLIHFCYFLTCS